MIPSGPWRRLVGVLAVTAVAFVGTACGDSPLDDAPRVIDPEEIPAGLVGPATSVPPDGGERDGVNADLFLFFGSGLDEVLVPCAVPTAAGGSVEARARAVIEQLINLDPATSDAVLVASSDWSDDRAEVVRKLVQAGRPLILSQPLDLSMLYAYELDMIRRDSGAVLVPILPDRLHPFMARLRNWIEIRLPAAGIETINFEHRLVARSKDDVLRALAGDELEIRIGAAVEGALELLECVVD